jgi:tetratricopeptide (TPR) repeat protein
MMSGIREGGLNRVIHRELVVLAILAVVAAAAFTATRAAARANRNVRLGDAAAWYQKGTAFAAAGRFDDATAAFRRAVGFARGNRTYQLALVDALVDAKHDKPARELLLQLRDATPEDATVNLRLARLTARTGALSTAVQYYQNALYGLWPDGAAAHREAVHKELIQLLLQHGDTAGALAQLLVLTANLPDTVPERLEAGRLYLSAGDPQRALVQFRRALILDPKNDAASAGAGRAAFESGDYVRAIGYLRRTRNDPGSARRLTVAELVVGSDPLRTGLTMRERQRRAIDVLSRALQAFRACGTGAPPPLAPASDVEADTAVRIQKQLARPRRPVSSDDLEEALAAAYRLETAMPPSCAGTPFDEALRLIGRRYELGAS